MNEKIQRKYATVLWVLSVLFLGRVVGQMLVVYLDAKFLPPMSEWYSGLLRYSLLLPTQILILYVMYRINVGVMRGKQYLLRRRERFGRFLLWFSLIYAVSMVARYFIAGAIHPERRWLPPGIIPIVFHWVLAGYIGTLSRVTLVHGAINQD